MEKDWHLKILYLESIDSTQLFLKQLLKEKKITPPYAVVANEQSNGIGSRENSWSGLEGNLFLSFALDIDTLPKDLKLESASIYFAYILKDVLNDLNSLVWLKWPNDFYIDNLKIGGMITNIVKNTIICGVGLNLVASPDGFGTLDIKVSREEILEKYFQNLEKYPSWKKVFSKYKIEFCRSQTFFTHNKQEKISLKNTELLDDGSIIHNGERIYSIR